MQTIDMGGFEMAFETAVQVSLAWTILLSACVAIVGVWTAAITSIRGVILACTDRDPKKGTIHPYITGMIVIWCGACLMTVGIASFVKWMLS